MKPELKEPNELTIANILDEVQDEVVTESNIVDCPVNLSNERHPDETFEEYKARRVQIKQYLRQHKMYQSNGENRKQRRTRKTDKLRFTKPMKKIRDKYMVGNVDVTLAVKAGIPLNEFLRVKALGLNYKELIEIAKEHESEVTS